jgi:hypothetical protein
MATFKVNAWVLHDQGFTFLGLETIQGSLYRNVAPGSGSSALVFQSADVRNVRKVASGLNTVVEFEGKDKNGWSQLTIIGPRGRIKKVFALLGFEF